MQGITLTFQRRITTGTDDFNNPIFTLEDVVVEDCLIAPISEPATAREQQALDQDKDQLRIHLPKAFTGSVSGSQVAWNGKLFELDSDSVVFMEGNTPTRWNRYIRAEFVANYQSAVDELAGVVYWGTDADTSLNDSQVMALANSAIAETLSQSFSLNGNGEYLYFAYPASFGIASVQVNGFSVTAWQIQTVLVDSISYFVYRSQYLQHGSNIQIELGILP